MKKEMKVALSGLTAAMAAVTGSQVADAAEDMAVDTWSGLYLGLGVGVMDGDGPFNHDGEYEVEQDVVGSAFAGYNLQHGNIVTGVEFALNSGAGSDEPDDGDNYEINFSVDSKLRLGYDIGESALLYGFVGISGVRTSSGSSTHTYDQFGVNYGIGADMKLSEQFSIGVEGLARHMGNVYGDGGDDPSKTHYQGMLRASFHF